MSGRVPSRLCSVLLWLVWLTVACSGGGSDSASKSPCPSGQALCAGTCVDVQENPLSCGNCTTTCGSDKLCDRGSCKAATQGCSPGTIACGGGCIDATKNASHCGSCDHACSAGQTCMASACVCTAGLTSCGTACVDVLRDNENCGTCNAVCMGGHSCIQGTCQCPSEQVTCGASCSNLQIDAMNCGACGNACSGGQVCMASQCACPSGRLLCGGACADLQSDAANCGACGTQCGLGQACAAGKCGGGGIPGPDGCSGLAQNLTLSELAVYQTVSVPVMKGGTEVALSARNTDIVVGRDGMFRVFVSTGAGFVSRALSARVYVQNGSSVDSYYAKATIAGPSQEATLASTFQVLVPKDKITSDTRYAVEVVECGGTDPAGVQAPRFPATDGLALGARVTGGLKIKLIPMLANSLLPDTSDSVLALYRSQMLATYPITSIDFSVGDQISVKDARDWSTMLDQIRAKRAADKPAADVYYFGVLKPAATLDAYCGSGCVAGIGFVLPDDVPASQQAAGRAALGLAYGDATSAETMVHEVGHNHGRDHAPCAPGGNITGVDANYPYDNAAVGVYGWDSRNNSLITPSHTDIMGYCKLRWLSDYTYDGLLNRVAKVNAMKMAEIYLPDAQIHPWRVALLDARGPRWGIPISEPEAPAGAAEQAEILDASSNAIATVTVYRTAVSEVGAFSVLVPEPEPDWASVRLIGAAALPF